MFILNIFYFSNSDFLKNHLLFTQILIGVISINVK